MASALLLVLCACDGASGGLDDGGGPASVPETYTYESRFEPGVGSVAHRGQTARQVLILDLSDYARALSGLVDDQAGVFADGVEEGEVLSGMEYFFSMDARDRADDPMRLVTSPASEQATYGDISASANLLAKLAGNDTATDHVDWGTAFSGWSDASLAEHGGGIGTPTDFVRAIFHQLEARAIERASAEEPRMSPVDASVRMPVHLTDDGVDLARLLEFFLHGGVGFAQATDDYADGDVEGKGLLADNTDALDGAPYTALEHAWDEAFGYFGAAEAYGDFSPEELAAEAFFADIDGDERIDLGTEYNFMSAAEAGRRDAVGPAQTEYGATAFAAFRRGRAIIVEANGPLSPGAAAALRDERDRAMTAWEQAWGATVVHHLNQVLAAMALYGTDSFDHDAFVAMAAAWSRAKGLALSFQFNPRSLVSASTFDALHAAIGDAPVLPGEDDTTIDDYRAALRSARSLLGTALELPEEQLGDDDGANGW